MPERYLAGAVAWAATLTEPVPELTALADALDADCALEPQVLREVLMGLYEYYCSKIRAESQEVQETHPERLNGYFKNKKKVFD